VPKAFHILGPVLVRKWNYRKIVPEQEESDEEEVLAHGSVSKAFREVNVIYWTLTGCTLAIIPRTSEALSGWYALI
jgi:hypothetical protein